MLSSIGSSVGGTLTGTLNGMWGAARQVEPTALFGGAAAHGAAAPSGSRSSLSRPTTNLLAVEAAPDERERERRRAEEGARKMREYMAALEEEAQRAKEQLMQQVRGRATARLSLRVVGCMRKRSCHSPPPPLTRRS